MITSFSKLKHLPVYTKSGQKLGKVCDLILDVETHQITEYLVKPSRFSSQEFLIKPKQIIQITKEKMIVEDALLGDLSRFGKTGVSTMRSMAGAK